MPTLNIRSSFTFAALFAMSGLVFGCASSAEDNASSDEAAVSADAVAVVPGAFKLYDAPQATPDPTCDRHTALTLTAGGKATVKSALGGFCEIMMPRDERTYDLIAESDNCGSFIYRGTLRGGRSIEIVDNRARTCEDLVLARIVVTEISDDIITTSYSLDTEGEPDGGAVSCMAIPTCDADHFQIADRSECLQDGACYERSMCGKTILCTGGAGNDF